MHNFIFPFILLLAVLNVPVLFLKSTGYYDPVFNILAIFLNGADIGTVTDGEALQKKGCLDPRPVEFYDRHTYLQTFYWNTKFFTHAGSFDRLGLALSIAKLK